MHVLFFHLQFFYTSYFSFDITCIWKLFLFAAFYTHCKFCDYKQLFRIYLLQYALLVMTFHSYLPFYRFSFTKILVIFWSKMFALCVMTTCMVFSLFYCNSFVPVLCQYISSLLCCIEQFD